MICKDCNNIPIKPYEGTNNECMFCRKKRLDSVVDYTIRSNETKYNKKD